MWLCWVWFFSPAICLLTIEIWDGCCDLELSARKTETRRICLNQNCEQGNQLFFSYLKAGNFLVYLLRVKETACKMKQPWNRWVCSVMQLTLPLLETSTTWCLFLAAHFLSFFPVNCSSASTSKVCPLPHFPRAVFTGTCFTCTRGQVEGGIFLACAVMCLSCNTVFKVINDCLRSL